MVVLTVFVLGACTPEPARMFTAAGTGVKGYGGDGGPATRATINHPRGFAALPDGGYLFADAFGQRVRRVYPDGTIRTVAGTGVAGFSGDGGAATAARLNLPHAVAAVPGGGFLIADEVNFRVRKVSASGIITTVAGTGVQGFSGDNGPATLAKIGASRGLAATSDGGYLIADSSNNRVRKVSSDGIIRTVAGTGMAGFAGDGGSPTAAWLNLPFGVTPISGGGFLISDISNNRVRRVLNGVITTVAGTGVAGFSGDGKQATAAQINGPVNTAVLSDGSFLIADALNHRIRKVSSGGVITTVAGTGSAGYSGDGAPATTLEINTPKAMLAFKDGFLIADSENSRVRYVGSAPAGAKQTFRLFGVPLR